MLPAPNRAVAETDGRPAALRCDSSADSRHVDGHRRPVVGIPGPASQQKKCASLCRLFPRPTSMHSRPPSSAGWDGTHVRAALRRHRAVRLGLRAASSAVVPDAAVACAVVRTGRWRQPDSGGVGVCLLIEGAVGVVGGSVGADDRVPEVVGAIRVFCFPGPLGAVSGAREVAVGLRHGAGENPGGDKWIPTVLPALCRAPWRPADQVAGGPEGRSRLFDPVLPRGRPSWRHDDRPRCCGWLTGV